jgi:O-antigen ligase
VVPDRDRVRDGLLAAYVVGLALSITVAETALVLLAIRWLVRLVSGRARPGWPLAWPIAAFAIVSLAAGALAARPADGVWNARFVVLLASIWILRDAWPDAVRARRDFLLLLGMMALISLVGLVQVGYCAELAPWTPVLGGVAAKCHRAHAFYSIYMTMGGVLAVGLLATLPILIHGRGGPRWSLAAWLLAAVGLAVTYVRGAWVGFGAGVLALATTVRHGGRLLLAGLLLLMLVLLLLPGVRSRAQSIADPGDPTSSERLLMWRSGMAMARDHLLTGVGPGQVKRVYPGYAAAEVVHKTSGHLHNTPIQILVERGVLGLLAWLWIFAAFFARTWPLARALVTAGDARHVLVAGGVAAVLGFLVAGLTEYNFGDTEVLLVTTLAMSAALVVEHDAGGAPPAERPAPPPGRPGA